MINYYLNLLFSVSLALILSSLAFLVGYSWEISAVLGVMFYLYLLIIYKLDTLREEIFDERTS